MPWFCPACRTPIRHSEFEDRPRLGALYRCPVCRLELELNPESNQLEPRPMAAPATDVHDRRTH